MIAEFTGRTVGETCTVCGKRIREDDGNALSSAMPSECSCEKFYLNWHGAIGAGKELRQILGTDGEPKEKRPGIHEICEQMESEGFYKNHERAECKAEIARRYEARSVTA